MGNTDTQQQDTITLMVMEGHAGSIRRVSIQRAWIRKGLIGLAITAAVAIGFSVDYVRARVQLMEFEELQTREADQREQIQAYSGQIEEIASKLARIDTLERKLRVITNLDPADPLPLPSIGGSDAEDFGPDTAWLSRAQRHKRIVNGFTSLNDAAGVQSESLESLLAHLEENSARLLATPSVTPTKGWVTSPFGYRTSPFTGNREFHKGLDIAGRAGTPVVAPADGEVSYVGSQRALGKAVYIRHGYGVVTKFGHLADTLVKEGEKVKRGQKIGLMGTTGRSTGPHLHYQVEVNRKAVNPQNYILD